MNYDMYMFYELDADGFLLHDTSPTVRDIPETKSLSDVILVIKHNPLNQVVIDKFIEMYALGVQWDWFYSYEQWTNDKQSFEMEISLLPTEDEEGNLLELPSFTKEEPLRPEQLSVEEYKDLLMIDSYTINEYLFRYKRATSVSSITVEVDGLIFDGDEDSQRRMLSAINAADTLGLTSTNWRLNDNSIVTVTKEQLTQAHAKAILSQSLVWIPE